MAKETFYFYDLETSGTDARRDRIMQFAGQRTDMGLNPIGEPDNILVKMTDDILPQPGAIMVTGITPQKTIEEGITEREFAKYFLSSIAIENTIIVGFNSIRFDNEFIRFMMYRNFYDAYEWSYKNGVTNWDILDVVRMTRALRPKGINWPFASDGSPANRLEMLTSVNKIEHEGAHDALSDVNATIALAKLIKLKQPKIFEYLLNMRDKQAVSQLVTSGQPFVYTSGRYSNESQKTTVAVMLADHPVYSGRVLVYDLSVDPSEFLKLSADELLERMKYIRDRTDETPARLPVKDLTFNKCPAVAPLGVLDKEALGNTAIDLEAVKQNMAILKSDPTFVDRLLDAAEKNQNLRQQDFIIDTADVDSRLYDGFFNNHDKKLMENVRSKDSEELADYHPNFSDERLSRLLLLYKARQLPKSLSDDEQKAWQTFRLQKLMGGGEDSAIARYLKEIQQLMANPQFANKQDILQDLVYWAESIAPTEEY